MLRQSPATFDLERVRCAASSSCALLVLAFGCSCQPLLVNIWVGGSAWELVNLRVPADEIPPTVTASLNRFEYDYSSYALPVLNQLNLIGLHFDSWDELCSGSSLSVPSPMLSSPAPSLAVTECDNSSNASTGSGCANFTSFSTAAPVAAGASFFTTTLDALADWDFRGQGHSHTCTLLKTGRALAYSACFSSAFGLLFATRARQASSLLCLLAGGICGGICGMCSLGALVSLASLSIHGLASGLGSWFLIGSLLSSTAAVPMVFYHAVKATPDVLPSMENKVEWILSNEGSLSKEAYEDFIKRQVLDSLRDTNEFDPAKLTRLDRHRMLQVALGVNITDEDETLEDWKRLEHHFSSKRGVGERHALGNNDMASITKNEQAVLAMDPQAFQEALDFCSQQSTKGKLASKVPQKILERAFQSIDVDRTGTVSLNEFRVALQRCGVASTRAAVDRILQTIDEDNNGSLDIEEFAGFFDEIQEMLVYDADLQVSNMLSDIFCRVCLLANIVGICLLTVWVIQGASSELIDIAFPVLGISTTALCVCVVALPLLQVMLGNQPAIWKQHFYRHCSDVWQHFLMGPFGRIIRLLGKYCSSCCRCRDQEPEDQVSGSETESPKQGRIIAWAEGDQTSSPGSKSQSSQPERRGYMLDTRLEESTEISDIEAPAPSDPDSPASSRKGSRRVLSKRSLCSSNSSTSRSPCRSSSKSRASQESTIPTRALSRESTSPRKTRRTRKRTTVKKSRATQKGDSTQESTWLPSFLRSNKAQRSRSTVRQGAKRSSLDAAYEPGHFAQAAERAALSRGQPVGSFSPMQVRDLRLPPPAEPEVFIL